MRILLTKPWLKAWSGLFINISAALIIAPLVSVTIAFPKDSNEFLVLLINLIGAIMFLLLTVKCEERLVK